MTTALAGTAWAEEVTLTATSGFGASYGTNHTFTSSSIGFKDSGVMYNSKGTPSGWAVKQLIQMRKSGNGAGEIYNTTGISTITSVEVTLVTANNEFTIYYGSSENPSTNGISSTTLTPVQGTFSYTNTSNATASATSYKFTFDLSSYNSKYIKIVNGSKANYVGSIVVNYEESSTPTCATPTFSPAAGTYTSAQNVEISTTTTGATIYYTTDGNDPTTSSSVYSSAISVSTNTTIKAMAVAAGYDNSSVASATYTILSIEHAGTEADPYTVADAITLLTAAPSTTFEDVYVSGIISQVDSYNSKYNSITYWISDDGTTTDQFEVYSGKGLNGADFSSEDDLIVGSEVTVKGNIKKYNSIFEFDVNSQIVSLAVPTYPIINAAATLNLEYDATNGEIAYTIDNPTDATLTAALTTGDWISNVTVDAVNNKVTFIATANEGNADRTATITLSYTGAQDKVVTVTQGHYVADYATLPFSFDGGRADIANTAGLTETGLGSDYNSSPKLKFDTTGDDLILKINERPGVLTFDVKGNPGGDPSAWIGTFTIQASADGTSYSDVVSYDNLASTKESKTVNNLPADARYIKFVYEKTQGNVALGNIHLAAYVAPQTYTLTIPATENVNISAAYGTDGIMNEGDAEEIEQGTAITLTVDVAEGYVLESLTVSGTEEGQSVTPTASTSTEGAYTFNMPTYNATVNATVVEYVAPVTAQYALATSITSGKRYVIASGTEDGTVQVMGDQANNNRPAVEATITNGVLSVSDEYEFVIESATVGEATGYSIYDENVPGYLYAAASGSNHLKTKAEIDVNGLWTITIESDGSASVKAEGSSNRNVMQYNNSSTLFSCYASASQAPVYLYEKVEPETESVTVGASGYATYCSENALDFTDVTEITAYVGTIDGTHLTFTPITQVPANTGLLLKAEGGATVDVPVIASAPALTITNCLTGTNEAITLDEDDYILNVVNGKAGFYRATTQFTALAAHRAYISAEAGQGVKSFIFDDDDATAIGTVESFTEEGAIYNVAGQRLQKMQKGINIVNGKKILK